MLRKMVLRTFRQRDLPPELGVQLLRCLEPWLRARVRGIKTWNEILYVWILADRLQDQTAEDVLISRISLRVEALNISL